MKAAKNCMEKGVDYAKIEIQRLERVLEKVMYLVGNKSISIKDS